MVIYDTEKVMMFLQTLDYEKSVSKNEVEKVRLFEQDALRDNLFVPPFCIMIIIKYA